MRTVLVTGANKGIGLAVVRRCLIDFEDVRCVMACRSTKRGEAARKKLISKNAAWGNRTYVLSMDQSSDESVKAAEETWAKTGFGGGEGGEKEIYAVVNNAGIASGSAEVILNVNVRGVKRVCDAFLKYVDKTNGRITMMSSGAGPGCVERCSSERQPFFLRDDVTWKDIEEVIDEAEGLEKAGKRLEDAGLSQLIGGACKSWWASPNRIARYSSKLTKKGHIAQPQSSPRIPSISPARVGSSRRPLQGATKLVHCELA